MSMDLVRPCAHCPFRNDIPPYLTHARVREIEESLDQGWFPCHETLDYDQVDPDSQYEEGFDATQLFTSKTEHCAGAMILLVKMERFSNLMRVFERLGFFEPSKLDMKSPVFDSFDQMAESQERQ